MVSLLALLAVFWLLQDFIPLRTAVQIGADEGFELAKATLCLKGYRLYSDVWDDHPPLHTFMITQVLKRLTSSVAGPRLVSVAFATLLLVSVFVMARRLGGLLSATVTTALLIASPGFMELSSSCMMEIPALTPAIVGLCVLGSAGGKLRLHGQERQPARNGLALPAYWREILAGILFGMALATKLMGVILLPLAVLILWLRDRPLSGAAPTERKNRAFSPDVSSSARRSAAETPVPAPRCATGFLRGLSAIGRLALIFGASSALCFAAINYLIDRGAFLQHFHQSWASHFTPAVAFEYGSPGDHRFTPILLLRHWEATLPAAVGIVLLLRRAGKAPMAILPIAWFALMMLVLAAHTPWWSYYYIYIAVPLCWCAGSGIALAFECWPTKPEAQRTRALRIHARRRLGAMAVLVLFTVCALPWMAGRLYLQISDIRKTPQTYYTLVLDEIARFKPFTQWIYADNLAYSFHTGIPVPPQLAVVSLKRLWSGEITTTQVGDEVRKFKPGVIALRNDSRELPFQDLLKAEYRLVYQDTGNRLYAHQTIADRPPQ